MSYKALYIVVTIHVVIYVFARGKLNVVCSNLLNWYYPTAVLKEQALIQREIHSSTKLICLRQDEIAQLDGRCDELTKEVSFLISEQQRIQNNLVDAQRVLRYKRLFVFWCVFTYCRVEG